MTKVSHVYQQDDTGQWWKFTAREGNPYVFGSDVCDYKTAVRVELTEEEERAIAVLKLMPHTERYFTKVNDFGWRARGTFGIHGEENDS